MKKILTFALIMLSIGAMSQQNAPKYKVTGIVRDSTTNEPVAYSTVIVRDTTKKLITSTYVNEKGAFEFRAPSGIYLAVVGFTGYTPDTIQFEIKNKNLELGTIRIQEGVLIQTVQVFGQIITSDIDKLTYNTSADPETPALTGLEMMRKVPMLSVDGEDNIQLKGQSDFKILVNGKPSTMMSKNYKDVLKSMPASSIKSIEVITNPPAKYDAEGIGGLINIITVRKSLNGYNGSVNLATNQWGSINGGGYVTGQIGKLALSGNLYASRQASPASKSESWRIDSLQDDRHSIYSDTKGEHNGLYLGATIDGSYEIDSLNLITLSISGNSGNGAGIFQNSVYYRKRDGSPYAQYASKNRNNYSNFGISGSLDYQHLFLKPDRTLTFSYRFEHTPSSSRSECDVENIFNYTDTYSRRSQNDELSIEHTIQTDYYDPLTEAHQIEAGLKYVVRPNTTNTNNEIWDEFINGWVNDNVMKNDMDYVQHIASFYGGYALKLKKFSAKAGFRGELTINQGTVKMSNQNIPLFGRYFNIVPYLTLNFKLTDVQNIRLGYTQRLRRPYIWDLNPYVNDLDPTSVYSGNPDLESVLNHSVDLSYSIYKQKWNISASISSYTSKNAIVQLKELQGPGEQYEGRLFSRPENIGNEQSFRIGLSGGLNLLENKLRINASVSGNYRNMDAPKAKLHSEGWNYNASGGLYAQPWKGGGIGMNAYYSSSRTNLQGKESNYFGASVSVSQKLLKDKLNINLSCNNPWETKRTYSYSVYGPGFSSLSESSQWSRNVRLSVQWRFGKIDAQVKKARRGITKDDGGDA